MDHQNNSGCNGETAGLSHEVQGGILRVSVRGSVGLQTATTYATRHQTVWSEHERILWDLRQFDPSGITSKDILNIQHAFAEIMTLRPGGRSAVLVGEELHVVVRVAMALREEQTTPLHIRAFLDEQEALSWLEPD